MAVFVPPQVHLPQGCLSLPVSRDDLIPFLDRILRESWPETPEPLTLIQPRRRAPRTKPVRVRPDPDPNHHLWNNHGIWFVAYTIHPTPVTKQRIRETLQTRCVELARVRRDEILARWAARGILAVSRKRLCPRASRSTDIRD